MLVLVARVAPTPCEQQGLVIGIEVAGTISTSKLGTRFFHRVVSFLQRSSLKYGSNFVSPRFCKSCKHFLGVVTQKSPSTFRARFPGMSFSKRSRRPSPGSALVVR